MNEMFIVKCKVKIDICGRVYFLIASVKW